MGKYDPPIIIIKDAQSKADITITQIPVTQEAYKILGAYQVMVLQQHQQHSALMKKVTNFCCALVLGIFPNLETIYLSPIGISARHCLPIWIMSAYQ
jgi:hypothetical protein